MTAGEVAELGSKLEASEYGHHIGDPGDSQAFCREGLTGRRAAWGAEMPGLPPQEKQERQIHVMVKFTVQHCLFDLGHVNI